MQANPTEHRRKRATRRWARLVPMIVGVAVAVMQIIPYGRRHTNPPVESEPTWSDADTRALTVRACFDCHSNDTKWPWYSNLAPASWIVQHDVDEGRRVLNYSESNRSGGEASESAEEVAEGEMPPAAYLLFHAEARLSKAERARLVRGLSATFRRGEGHSDGDAD